MKKVTSANFTAALLFIIVLVFFVLANMYTYVKTPQCCDRIDSVGFPIPYFDIGGIAGASDFSLGALILDISVALGVAALVAFVAMWFFKDAGAT